MSFNAGGYFPTGHQAMVWGDFCWCHCHLQCQIYFGLGDGLDTEEFSNIGVSLGYSHYFYTEVCSLMTTGGDLCHLGLSKLIRINELVPA